MGDAGPPATSGKTDGDHGPDVSRALEALRLAWGDTYVFGHNGKQYVAALPHVIGPLISADTPEELGELLADGFGADLS